MENATVTLPLKELDELRDKIKIAEDRAKHFENQKEFNVNISVDMYYDVERNYTHHTFSYGDMNLIKEYSDGKGYKAACDLIKEAFDKVMNNSKELRFYNKFPKWFIKLFKCD